MIADSLFFLSKLLDEELKGTDTAPKVVVDNVAKLDDPDFKHKEEVLISLINIEEEKTLKNTPHYTRSVQPPDPADPNGQPREHLAKQNPTIYVNLYVLISCGADYVNALPRIDQVVLFLQGKNVFKSDEHYPNATFPSNVEKIVFELFSMNFEQINHLWGILGGKYVPSVLYKMRLLPMQAERKISDVEPIREFRTDSHKNN
ncbi:MAG: DUF4255 domain-containing protein [Lewinellaceae bacterium]|jgi:hypothetical protein|nr:DUF4255 domain-containing protein [Lewinellaceae bacterium]